MKRTRTPSKLGPCITLDIQSGSKFCGICGHTSGSHRFIAKNIPIGGGWFVWDTFRNEHVGPPRVEGDAQLVARQKNREALAASVPR